jgi:mRNA interferase MazF
VAIRRGDIYWVDWSPARGSEQSGVRPALVIQNDVGNRASPTTIVAAMTTRIDRMYPFMVFLQPSDTGLENAGAVNLSQLVTIDQHRLSPPDGEGVPTAIGHVSYPKMAEVDRALRVSLALR